MAMNDNPFANLSPEQLLQALQSGRMSNGMVANAYTGGMGGGQDGYYGPTSTQYGVYDGQSYHPGQMNYSYDSNGGYLGSHVSDNPSSNDKLAMLSAALLAGGVGMFGGAGSAGAGGTLGEGWAGAAGGGSSGLGAGVGAANAVATPITMPGADVVTTLPSMGEIGTGAAMTPEAAAGTWGTITGPAAMGAAGAGGLGAAGGGLLSSLADTLGISPSLLAAGVGLLGAAAGSKGVKQTVDKQPWGPVASAATGPGGLFDMAGQLSKNQMANNQWGAIGDKAMGLLNAPVAGNGVAQFNARPRFGVRG